MQLQPWQALRRQHRDPQWVHKIWHWSTLLLKRRCGVSLSIWFNLDLVKEKPHIWSFNFQIKMNTNFAQIKIQKSWESGMLIFKRSILLKLHQQFLFMIVFLVKCYRVRNSLWRTRLPSKVNFFQNAFVTI